jgi:hypothetical protein
MAGGALRFPQGRWWWSVRLRGTVVVVGPSADNLLLNMRIFGGGDTYGGDSSWRAHRLLLPPRRGGKRTTCRAQGSPRQKQSTQTPIWARSSPELICRIVSSRIARPPPPPALICIPSSGPSLALYRSGRPLSRPLTCLPCPTKRVHTITEHPVF